MLPLFSLPVSFSLSFYLFHSIFHQVAILQLQMLLEESDTVPWAALNYLTGQVTYGGRVTDDLDRRCLISLLNKFYCPALFAEGFSYDSSQVPLNMCLCVSLSVYLCWCVPVCVFAFISISKVQVIDTCGLSDS